MPFYGRKIEEVGAAYQAHFTNTLARTITRKPLVMYPFQRGSIQISFRDARLPSTARLSTSYGPMDLFIGQFCDAVEDEGSGQLRLRTRSYKYTLQPQGTDDPLFRWEYIGIPGEDAVYCRHHLQGRISFEITDDRGRTHVVSLNDWHLPTGWVTVEEVIRYCIVDLGVTPLSEEWDRVLRESEETSGTAFANISDV